MGQLIYEADSLRLIAFGVAVLSSRKVAQLVQQVPDRIFEYFDAAMGDDIIYAAKAPLVLEDIRAIEGRLKQAVREDLKTKLIDPRVIHVSSDHFRVA